MDKSWFDTVANNDTPRFYELGDYKFKQSFIKRKDFALVEDKPEDLKARVYNLTKGRSKPRIKLYREKSHLFDKTVLDLPDNTFLEGFWRSEERRVGKECRSRLWRMY